MLYKSGRKEQLACNAAGMYIAACARMVAAGPHLFTSYLSSSTDSRSRCWSLCSVVYSADHRLDRFPASLHACGVCCVSYYSCLHNTSTDLCMYVIRPDLFMSRVAVDTYVRCAWSTATSVVHTCTAPPVNFFAEIIRGWYSATTRCPVQSFMRMCVLACWGPWSVATPPAESSSWACEQGSQQLAVDGCMCQTF